MIKGLPTSIDLLFTVTTIAIFILFIRSLRKSRYNKNGVYTFTVGISIMFWMIFQSILGYKGFYQEAGNMIPRHLVAYAPPILCIIFLMATRQKGIRKSVHLKSLTGLHFLRIPVEISIWSLAVYKQVPYIITFEGANLDILVGLSVPFVSYFVFYRKTLSNRWLITWNICGILFLFHALYLYIGQYDTFVYGISHFPYIWLPSFIIPVFLFSHLASISKLLNKKL